MIQNETHADQSKQPHMVLRMSKEACRREGRLQGAKPLWSNRQRIQLKKTVDKSFDDDEINPIPNGDRLVMTSSSVDGQTV